MNLITLPRLNRATYDVSGQLQDLGFWSSKLGAVNVYLTTFSATAYGWQYYGTSGDICIPAVSLARVGDRVLGRPRIALRDILRHEYAHALADCQRGLIRSTRFSDAFDGPHSWERRTEYNPELHITPYAATNPGEDFAEVFMLWVKYGGQLPGRYDTPAIRKKWAFVERLRCAVRRGLRRW